MGMPCFVQDVAHFVSLGAVFFPCHQLNTHPFNTHAWETSVSRAPDCPSTSLCAADTKTNESACRDTLAEALLWFIKAVPEQCSINALYHWKLAVVWAGLLNSAARLRVKNDRVWLLGIGTNKNLKLEQPGDWSIHSCISFRVGLCISRWQPKNNMCWESSRCMARFSTPTQAFWRVLSVRGAQEFTSCFCVDFCSYYLQTISQEMLKANLRQIFTKWNTITSHNINP